jgi:hypothetical protein
VSDRDLPESFPDGLDRMLVIPVSASKCTRSPLQKPNEQSAAEKSSAAELTGNARNCRADWGGHAPKETKRAP